MLSVWWWFHDVLLKRIHVSGEEMILVGIMPDQIGTFKFVSISSSVISRNFKIPMAQRPWQSGFSKSFRIGSPSPSATRSRTRNHIPSNSDPDSTVPPSQQQIASRPARDHTHQTHPNPITTTHSTVVDEPSATSVVESSRSPLQGILMPSSRLKFF